MNKSIRYTLLPFWIVWFFAIPTTPALAQNNLIFDGGNEDGFAIASFLAPSYNDIFGGGNADGFDFDQKLIIRVFPIELLSFEGSYKNGKIELGWITLSETNNSHFELERSPTGRVFTQIASVSGAGTSPIENSYEYLDDVSHLIPNHPVLYYRLKQVDLDGKFQYSQVISVQLGNVKPAITAFPNPTTGMLFLEVMGASGESITISVFDLEGRKIYTKNFHEIRQQNRLSLDLSNLPNGVYSGRAENSTNSFPFKILISR